MTIESLLITGACIIISLLFAGNIYWIKKLIDKMDLTEEIASDALKMAEEQSRQLAEQTEKMGELKTDIARQISDARADIKQLSRLEIDVAVVKAQLGLRIGRREGATSDLSSAG